MNCWIIPLIPICLVSLPLPACNTFLIWIVWLQYSIALSTTTTTPAPLEEVCQIHAVNEALMCSDYLLLQYVGLHMSQLEVQLKGTTFTKDASVSCKILGGVNLLGTLETDM